MIARLWRRISWLFDPGTTLKQRVANAGAWAFLLNMSNRLLVTARTVVLARLLTPADFGLIGIALLVIEALNRFTEVGLDKALVQRKDGLDDLNMNTAWTVEAVRGVTLAGLLALAAPLVADFFSAPDALPLIRFMALGLAIGGLRNIGVVTFDKELEFQRRFIYRSLPHLADLLISVGMALLLRNAWALAFGWLAGRITVFIASYLVHPYRPRLRFDSARARSMFGFSVWLLGSQILLYLTFNLDDAVVGRVIDTTALGLYQLAFTISQLTTTEITTVINQVAFPAYAKLQDQPQRLGRAYVRTTQLVAFLSFPAAAGLWLLADEIVAFFLGSQWLPMLPAFNVLLIWGLIRSLLATTGPLFHGMGKPHLATRVQLAQLVLLAIAIYPLTTTWGIVGAAWATVVAAIGPDAWAIRMAIRESTASPKAAAKALTFPAAHSALMVAALVALSASLPTGPATMLWMPPVGAVVYAGLAAASHRWLGYAEGGLLGRPGKV